MLLRYCTFLPVSRRSLTGGARATSETRPLLNVTSQGQEAISLKLSWMVSGVYLVSGSAKKMWKAPSVTELPRILAIAALKSELEVEGAPEGVGVMFSGVGKINAAIAAAIAVLKRKPAIVVNYSTCGGLTKRPGDLVEISHVVQRDMMAMPSAPRGIAPWGVLEPTLASGHGSALERHPRQLCYVG